MRYSLGLSISRARLGSLSNPRHFAAIASLDLGFGSPRRIAGLEELNSYSIIMGVQVSQQERRSKMPPIGGPSPAASPSSLPRSLPALPRWEGLAPESSLTSSTRTNCLDDTKRV